MKHGKEAVLVYCMVKGELHHVSEYAYLSPGQRPAATCPECDGPVVMKLGKIKIFHAAHAPGALCTLTNPETALHFNTKVYVYQQLIKGREILIPLHCAGYDVPAVGSRPAGHISCRSARGRAGVWTSDWTRVEMERYAGSRKPDIVLYKGGEVSAAIEVCATHAVDVLKAADLETAGVRWLEIKAEEDFDWVIGEPLPYSQIHPELPAWTCERCQVAPASYVETMTALEAQLEESSRLRAAEEKRQREIHERYYGARSTVKCMKTIYVYRDGATFDRHEIHLCQFDGGMFLRYGWKGRILGEEASPLTPASFERLEADYQSWRFTLGASALVVEATRWLPPPQMIEELHRYVRPYNWNQSSRQWEPVALFPQTTTDSLTDGFQ
jgi:hypothetical protein